jgi:hypothetical protein
MYSAGRVGVGIEKWQIRAPTMNAMVTLTIGNDDHWFAITPSLESYLIFQFPTNIHCLIIK